VAANATAGSLEDQAASGTRPDEDYVLKRSREDVVNFGRHRDLGSAGRVVFVAIAVIAVLGLLAFFALT
jgi:hypothetical protein